MSVHSDGEGKGSTFTMDIPLCRVQEEGSKASATVTPSCTLGELQEYSYLDRSGERDVHSQQITVRLASPVCEGKHRDLGGTEHSLRESTTAADAGLTALVVDDAPLNRKMLCRLIRHQFTHITEASDGLSALHFMRTSLVKPDVVLLDFVMPNMDGPTAAKEMRMLGYSGLIVGVTGNALPADVELFLDRGADKVLMKPLKLEDLDAVLASELNDSC